MNEPHHEPTTGPSLDEGGREGRVPIHVRQIDIRAYERDGFLDVVARLTDDRPWAAETDRVEHVHDMTLTVTVRRAGGTIESARATMQRFPHAECPQIEEAFRGLVGLNVGRGYNRAVQERFGRALGCTHLEFLARAIGPAIVQAGTSASARERAGRPAGPEEPGAVASGTAWILDTCHVWAAGGPGPQKLEMGWRPGVRGYPAPSAVSLRRSRGPALSPDDRC